MVREQKKTKNLDPISATFAPPSSANRNVSSSEDPLHQHKLCGFLCAVVSVNLSNEQDLAELLPFGSLCTLFSDISEVGFRCEDGLLLFALRMNDNLAAEKDLEQNSEAIQAKHKDLDNGFLTAEVNRVSSRKRKVEKDLEQNSEAIGAKDRDLGNGFSTPKTNRISSRKRKVFSLGKWGKRRRKVGLAHGRPSVVHQLHALTVSKCLSVVARVVGAFARGGDSRAVVLVDVYLPLALWSGWQFPRSAAMAASLFSHLSCNWEERDSFLVCDGNHDKFSLGDDGCIWKPPDCHVLGCKVHYNSSDSAQKRSFELHEIFKSLPGVRKEGKIYSTSIRPASPSLGSGIWDVSDDVLAFVLAALVPKDLIRVAATCRHLRSLAVSIMPCMKLKLFPHQQAAVEWMLQRERNAEVLMHPLYMDFSTEDGFHFYINAVSGEISTGMAPTINDFRGGMFCDEPGLGKTITALSLILKTHGTLADPPPGVEVKWCSHNPDQRCGYYELGADNCAPGNFMSMWKRFVGQNRRRGLICPEVVSPKFSSKGSSSSKRSLLTPSEQCGGIAESSCGKLGIKSCKGMGSLPTTRVLRCTRSLSRVKRNLLETYEDDIDRACIFNGSGNMKNPKSAGDCSESNETWVQCDACSKWRKLLEKNIPDATLAWFCSMNSDPLYQNCTIPEESWDYSRSITYLPGFYTKGTPSGKEQNILFFMGVLKDHCMWINSETKKALNWLANLSPDKLLEMETIGVRIPILNMPTVSGRDAHSFYKIFQAFGLVRRVERGIGRWHYPCTLENLAFDLLALRIALTRPLDLFRLYLSRATLIVVPANLVGHWNNQIQKHVSPGKLRVCVWTDHKKPGAHNLAWDYDIVITTFNRLSIEWGPRKKSILMQVHWLRVMIDEGHTLGSSLSLTNKLQMAISLTASNRWLLTGTPTPDTPGSQVAHLQPMLKFLHEETYGQNQKLWETGVLKPFEAEMEEGRSRLVQLLQRCMISARKTDLHTIPPCVKKVTFLHFTEEHAQSYNELVVTVRRNILMADWNDPSHVESLLNPKQWKFRSTTIRNVRLSCCVAGHIKVTDAGQDIQETMDILVEQGLDPVTEEYAFIKYSLLNGGSCFRCKEWCRLPVITPCRHLLCLDCVALDSERCTFPGCGNAYQMQSPEILTRPENPNPKWSVPQDLIELQPSYKQDNWDPDWQSTSSSKVAHLVERLKGLQDINKKMGFCLDERDDMKPIGEVLLPSQKCQWDFLIHHEDKMGPHDESPKILPEKVIIFSQFLEHIHVIEQQLTVAGIKYAGMYSPMHSSNKMKSLLVFQHDPNCMALLMDGSAALGLDLSFVTHVFLMEPIWDRSMEEQVISRAHRMGATRPINVETLAMRGTIEEQMLEFLQDPIECRRVLQQGFCRTDFEGVRARNTLHDFAESNYLARLSFVRTKVII